MKKTIILFIFTLLLFGCSNEEEFNKFSKFNVAGEKTKIFDPQTGLDISRGEKSPVIDLDITNGATVTYPDNRPTIFLFVAHWCPYCMEEIPEVIQWIDQADLVNKDVSVVLVVTHIDSEKNNYPPDQWLFNENWQYPVIYDDKKNSLSDYFGITYFPSWVFTESDGTIALTHAGRLGIEELSKLVN